MKYLALFLIINSVAWSQTPHFEDAQHHEAGPKGREAQEAAKRGNPGQDDPNIQEQKQKGY